MVAYRGGAPIRADRFIADVTRLAHALPPAAHVLNACEDRYRFCVGFAATLLTGRVSLLPSSHASEFVRRVAEFAPGAVCLTDDPDCSIALPRVDYSDVTDGAGSPRAVPSVDATQQIAWVFTSGSTGVPVAHAKRFGPLVACVHEEARRLGLSGRSPCTLVATVPPQHMYGLESTVLLALANGHALCAERPFYPADIAAALESVPRPRLLVTTPVHLRALLGAELALPAVDLIVCSTAPLEVALALEAERRFDARLVEIYGSTETGQIASRSPTQGPAWRLWSGVSLDWRASGTWAHGGHVEEPTRLNDVLEPAGPDGFLLHGRESDLVNIAGKRSSLKFLNEQLAAIPGVADGAFFHLDEARGSHPHTGVARIAACVVAPGLTAARLLEALRERIDAVFLPRPLLLVERLPRNATGKLTQAALQALATARSGES